ncbi:MAG: quinolinate synthase NadA [Candidatus Aminicenantia bacterium]
MTMEISSLQEGEILNKIKDVREKLGDKLIILAHFYQSENIVRFADFVGDSLQLAQEASKRKDVPYIVFCSVSFMAEMARILCSPEQEVLHPAPDAKCPLAEMAKINDVEKAWGKLSRLKEEIIPVVYVNSTAELKAFCGRNGGAVCTSSNAKKVFEWALNKGGKIFFFPDENLGRNTAHSLGIEEKDVITWDPRNGKQKVENLKNKKVILWKGFCYVHTEFLPFLVERLKGSNNELKVIVHPECFPEVCKLSDFVGSTSFIKRIVENSPSGSKWAIGTEWNLVRRLQINNPDKYIIPLTESICCQMAKVTPEKLLHVLEGLLIGELRGRVLVEEKVATDARIALQRMLEIS